MGNITTSAILLRYANYKDFDRMITLFSPEYGKLNIMARGCRRPKSALLNACELFSTGEYVLYQSKDLFLLNNATIHETFHPLRLDYAALTQGTYLLNLAEAALQPNQPAEDLFRLLIKTLHVLAYGQQDAATLLSLFLFHYANLLGYKPSLNNCVNCGSTIMPGEPLFFDIFAGGISCFKCNQTKKCSPLSGEHYEWLKQAVYTGPQNVQTLIGTPPFKLLQSYVEQRLEYQIKSSSTLSF